MKSLLLISVFALVMSSSLGQDYYSRSNPTKAKLNAFSALSYNVWALPFWHPKSGLMPSRFKKMKRAILTSNYDLICLQECFSKRFRKKVITELAGDYHILTNYNCNSKNGLVDLDCYGGLITLSKFPIITEAFYAFPKQVHMRIDERIGAKGFLVSTIKINLDTIHVVNTHLYAGNHYKAEMMRLAQLKHMHHILKANDYLDKCIIYLGDFNVTHPEVSQTKQDKISKNYIYLTDSLDLIDTAPTLENNHYSIDSRINKFCNKKDGLQKLDYSFLNNNCLEYLKVTQVATRYSGAQSYSDHLAWLTEFDFIPDLELEKSNFTIASSK